MAPGPRVGLVLGGGGRTGQAFHQGALSELERLTGWDARTAELVVGTSVGALVAAYLRGGFTAADQAARTLDRPLTPDGAALLAGLGPTLPLGRPVRARGLPRPANGRLLARGLRHPRRTRPVAVAAGLLPAGSVDSEAVVSGVRRLHPTGWPPGLLVTAVRLRDGARVVFGAPDAPRAPVADAVAASAALPGWFRPVVIDGEAYVDGGTWTPTNADVLAGRGLDLVVVLAPMAAEPGRLHHDAAAPIRLVTRRWLRHEVRAVRRSGTPVLVLAPDRAAQAVLGFDTMAEDRGPAVLAAAADSVPAALLRSGLAAVLERAAAAASRSAG